MIFLLFFLFIGLFITAIKIENTDVISEDGDMVVEISKGKYLKIIVSSLAYLMFLGFLFVLKETALIYFPNTVIGQFLLLILYFFLIMMFPALVAVIWIFGRNWIDDMEIQDKIDRLGYKNYNGGRRTN